MADSNEREHSQRDKIMESDTEAKCFVATHSLSQDEPRTVELSRGARNLYLRRFANSYRELVKARNAGGRNVISEVRTEDGKLEAPLTIPIPVFERVVFNQRLTLTKLGQGELVARIIAFYNNPDRKTKPFPQR